MTLYTITITEVGTRGTIYTIRVKASAQDAALQKALHKRWGRGTIWQPDSGLRGYGQVFKSMAALGYKGDHSYSSQTNRARLDITP